MGARHFWSLLCAEQKHKSHLRRRIQAFVTSVCVLQGPPASDGWFYKTFAYGPLLIGGAQGAPGSCIPRLLHSSSGSSPDACAAARSSGQPCRCADGAFGPAIACNTADLMVAVLRLCILVGVYWGTLQCRVRLQGVANRMVVVCILEFTTCFAFAHARMPKCSICTPQCCTALPERGNML